MAAVIFKIILSSSVLLAFYYLFLERERIFLFNRIFLLTALVFSYVIPFVPVKNFFTDQNTAQLVIGDPLNVAGDANLAGAVSVEWTDLLLLSYGLISLFLLLKFIFSLAKIKLLKGEKIIYKNQKMVILDEEYSPFSFLDAIYLSRNYLINDEMEERIFLHEKCHVRGKHSADILFLEFLKIFSWCNPALFFFKKAMITNHEYLADEYVLQKNYDVSDYQHLILQEINTAQNINLTHQFDFNNTKKRFIMMTSKNSRFAGLKKLTLLPVLAILFVLFAKKVSAHTETPAVSEGHIKQYATQDAVSFEKEDAAEKITFFRKTTKNSDLQKDTIRKKQDGSVSTPPPPTEFDQIPAEFPGGPNALRNLVSTKFDTSVFKGDEGLIKTTVFLSIDETGKISNIVAEGENSIFNAEAVRAITSANEGKIWKPATENNQPVKTVYKLPLTMQFEKPAAR